jgi:hypothetical protein
MLGMSLPLLAALAAVLPGGAPAQPASVDLNAAAASVCRPTFMRDGAPSLAGTGFILHAPAYGRRDVLVSAHHLFGMATATTGGMPWRDTPRRVTSATCRSLDHLRTWRAGPAAAVPGVHAFWRVPDVKDVAVLPVVDGPPTTLTIARAPAKPGDVVWVLAEVEHAGPTDVVAHRARVIPTSGFIGFVYAGAPFDTANISGAPIVDADGQVVGVNVGAGRTPDGALVGVGDDLATLQSALQALPAPPPGAS